MATITSNKKSKYASENDMSVRVDVSHIENSTDLDELIIYAVKNCQGFKGAFYNESKFEDGFVYAYFYFKNEEDAIMFNLRYG